MAAGRVDIAIVGNACRLPAGVDSPAALWERLRAGENLVGEIPSTRWNTDLFHHPRQGEPGRSYTFRAGVLDNPAAFDPGFFGISPREAEQMDPQQRVLLETAYEAIESAGWTMSGLSRANCAVYVGVSGTDYANIRLGDPSGGDAHFMTGNTLSVVANRLSYAFDLAGPSMAVDTACSSAVAALYEACCGLAEDRFEMALVGAVQMLLSPFPFLGFSRASMLSDYGQSRAFAEGASGYVRGEGSGVLALKPLARALADGDPVRAVIRAVDINQDGRTNGIALPSGSAQLSLLQRIYPAADVDPGELDYFEAHGTGTAVGDPTEASAIGTALGQTRAADDPLYIGSIKTNIGHLEPAAGMAGVLKAMLTLEHGEIPPSLHAETLNPIIPFDELNLSVARGLTPLKRRAGAGLVGVNSFGFGGLNGHVIVEGPPRRAARRRSLAPANDGAPEPAPWPLALSARGEDALAARAGQLADILEGDPSLSLRDVAYTLWRRRSHMERRLVARAADRTEMIQRLRQAASGETAMEGVTSGAVLGSDVRTGFVFSGNGAQWAGMGQTLLSQDPAFAAGVRRASEAISAHAGWAPLDLLAGPPDAIELDRTEIAQPLLFTVQVGLIDAFAARGIAPDAVVGHSVGEIAAAYASGALDLEQAALVIVRRSEAQAMTRGLGRMAAVTMDSHAIGARIGRSGGRIELAAINSPNAVTLAGEAEALEALVETLSAEGVDARMLDLDYAFHSRAMESARAPLAASLSGLAPRPSRLPFYSTVHGEETDGETLNADYWWRNIRSPVQFRGAIASMLESAPGAAWTLLEIGPHPILQAYLRQTARGGAAPARPLGAMARQANDIARIEAIADEAFCLGARRDADAVGPERGDVADLPAYPWRHADYWYKKTDEAEGLILAKRDGALLGFRARPDIWVWDAQIDADAFPYLADHKVGASTVFPAAGYISVLLEAAAAIAGDDAQGPFGLEEFEIRRPLVLDDDQSTMLRVKVEENGRADILARSRLADAPWSLYARARIVRGAALPAGEEPPTEAGLTEADPDDLYRQAADIGLDYGPAFRPIEALSVGSDMALAALATPEAPPRGGRRIAAPEQIDGAMQALIAVMMRHEDASRGEADGGDAMLPVGVKRIVARQDAVAAIASARMRRASARTAVADLALFDDAGRPTLIAEGARFQRIALKDRRALSDQVYAWRWTPLTDVGAAGTALPTTPAKLASAARVAAPKQPDSVRAERTLDRILRQSRPAAQTAQWRAFWDTEPGWSAEAALVASVASDVAPDDARIEQMLSGGPAFDRPRRAVAAALTSALDTAPPGRVVRVLEIGSAAGPLAESYRREIEAATVDWIFVDDAADRRNRAAAVGATAISASEFDPSTIGPADILVAPFALSPSSVESALPALAPGGQAIVAPIQPRPWLDAVWRAAGADAAADSETWDAAMAPLSGAPAKSVDCGAAAVQFAAAPDDEPRVNGVDADAPLEGRWLVAAGAGDQAAAKAFARRLVADGLDVNYLPISEDITPANVADQLDGVDMLAVVLGAEDPDYPSSSIVTVAAAALGAARAGGGDASARLLLLSTTENVTTEATVGLAAVLANETPNLKPLMFTARKGARGYKAWADDAVAALPSRISAQADRGEDVAALDRAGHVRAPRLAPLPLQSLDRNGLGFKPGALESVGWRQGGRASGPLPKDALEVDVRAAGVNFRDVMFGLGILPEEAVEAGFAGATVGMEAAGVVAAVGDDVTRFKPGDHVVCVASGCFGDRVRTLESAVARIPEGQSFAAAATLPIVALTAYYSLATQARLSAADTVLIHGAAGGVGLAAIQYAQHVGARVIATAGTDEKRALLRRLGVEHVSDSRSLAFVDDVRRWTDGRGVDVALNSLAGEAMSATLAAMRPFGRFIELGKRDFFENTEVGLKRLRENISYFAVDADQLLAARPEIAAELFRDVGRLIADGVFRALPYRAFPSTQVPEALKWMQRARHVGKVVVEAPTAPNKAGAGLPVKRDGAYLVVGGAEGFGLETAKWLAKRGAGKLVLASRRGAEAPGIDEAIETLASLGADASAAALDVTDAGAVERLLRRIDSARRPLRGVIHAAAVYADGIAAEMSLAAFRRAVSVKADGAAGLDRATRTMAASGRPLDFFILYSSATTALGNPGQANYVAGNAAVEGLARTRQADGLPAMAVAWGPISATGALKRQAAVEEHLERQLGRPAMQPEAALDLLDPLWASGEAAPIVLDIDWRSLSQRMRGAARFGRVAPAVEGEDGSDFLQLIADLEEADARDVVAELIAERVADVLGMDADQVDVSRPVADLGLDSLMGMELKLGLEERIGVELPAMLLAEGASVSRIAEKVTNQLRAGAGIRDDRARSEADKALRQHAETLDPEAVEDAISSVQQEGERRRLLS